MTPAEILRRAAADYTGPTRYVSAVIHLAADDEATRDEAIRLLVAHLGVASPAVPTEAAYARLLTHWARGRTRDEIVNALTGAADAEPTELTPAEVLDACDALRTITDGRFTGPIGEQDRQTLARLIDHPATRHCVPLGLLTRILTGQEPMPLPHMVASALRDLTDCLPQTSEADEEAWLAAREHASTEQAARDQAVIDAAATEDLLDALLHNSYEVRIVGPSVHLREHWHVTALATSGQQPHYVYGDGPSKHEALRAAACQLGRATLAAYLQALMPDPTLDEGFIRRLADAVDAEAPAHYITIEAIPEDTRDQYLPAYDCEPATPPCLVVAEHRPGQPVTYHGHEHTHGLDGLRAQAREVAAKTGAVFTEPTDPAVLTLIGHDRHDGDDRVRRIVEALAWSALDSYSTLSHGLTVALVADRYGLSPVEADEVAGSATDERSSQASRQGRKLARAAQELAWRRQEGEDAQNFTLAARQDGGRV